MSDYTVKHVDEMARTFGGGFVLCRASLGGSAFGLQILDVPQGWEGPEHSHEGMQGEMAGVANDGQEEVYFGLEGQAVLQLDDEQVELDPGVMVRVGPAQMRQVTTPNGPAKLLVIGGVPGGAYKAPGFTEIPA